MRRLVQLLLAFAFLVVPAASAFAQLSDIPNARLTPGTVVTTDAATVCRPGYAHSIRPRAHAWRRLREEVYARYGIPRGHRSALDAAGHRHPLYTIDHLIPLELGGAASDVRNLWPQPRDAAVRKDRVEDALHERVCSRRISLTAAQKAIARNWKTAVP